jgi:hypothetical protein
MPTPQLFRSFAIGFAIGVAGVAAVAVSHGSELKGHFVPAAYAAPVKQ